MEYVNLGKIAKIKTGKLDANAANKNGKYPFFTCSKEPLTINTYSYDCECVLVAGNGDLNVKYYNGKFDAYQRTYIIEILDKNKYNTKYIYLLLISYINALRSKAIGGVIKYIKLGNLTSLKVPMIDIIEQEKIVKKLFKLDKVINIKALQLKTCDKLIKSQFVEMFGDPLLIEDDNKIELKNIMLHANNGMPRRGNDLDGNIVLRLVELQRNKIIYDNVNRIKLTEKEMKKYLLDEGDVLFARVNGNPENVGRCAYYRKTKERIFYNDHIIRVKFDLTKVHPEYLCLLLNDEYGKKEFKNKIKTSAGQYTISQDGIEKVKVYLPSVNLQNKFADIVKQIDKQKFVIENSLENIGKLVDLW